MKWRNSKAVFPPIIKLNFSEVLQKEYEVFSFYWHYNDALQVSLDSNHPRLSHCEQIVPLKLIAFHQFTPAESETLFTEI